MQKREEYHDKYMHFVVIASTKYASLRLEAGVTHYEKLESSASRDFVVQFDRKKQQLINFYMQDFLKAISLSLRVSPVSAFDKK